VEGAHLLEEADRDLLERVEEWAGPANLAALDERFLCELAASEGVDFATALLYHRIVTSPHHGRFIRHVERMQLSTQQDVDVTLAIAPGAFYREHPQTGADGRRVRAAAAALGCRAHFIPTQSVGSAAANGRIICDWLLACAEERIVICSLSKGGADVKMALAEPGAAEAFRNVVAWLNVGGIMRGSPIAAWLLRRPWIALAYRLLFWLRGQDFRIIVDLDRGAGCPLDCDVVPPAHVCVIHVVGFPLRRDIRSARTRRWHRRLASFGPNDGATLLADACCAGGLIFPVWGADHYFDARWNQESIVAALLRYVDADLNRTFAIESAAAS
jgi:hypothetical protein